MRLLALVLAACAGATPPPAAPCPAPAPPREAARPTEAEIKQRSHDVLLAFDHGDFAAWDALVARDFIHMENAHASTRAKDAELLAKRKPGAPYIAKRTWEDEKVYVQGDSALFVGKATEIQGGNDVHGGYRYVGWYTLQWVPEGDTWKLRLWSWQRATEPRDFWNDVYKNDTGFTKEPNRLLVDTVQGKKPGTALDLTMGQGRNALFLASRGWKVTGVDMADEGIAIARAEAAKRKLTVEMIEANIDTWDFGTARWDLVTMIYAGASEQWLAKVKASLKPGGLFVLEYFAYDPERGQDDGIKPGALAKTFAAGYEILRDDLVEDVPDWAKDRAKLVRFVARKK